LLVLKFSFISNIHCHQLAKELFSISIAISGLLFAIFINLFLKACCDSSTIGFFIFFLKSINNHNVFLNFVSKLSVSSILIISFLLYLLLLILISLSLSLSLSAFFKPTGFFNSVWVSFSFFGLPHLEPFILFLSTTVS
jgi:hypothetical protein